MGWSKLFSSEDAMKVFGGEKINPLFNDIEGNAIFFNCLGDKAEGSYDFILKKGVRIDISEGEYDWPTNLPSLLDWLYKLEYMEKYENNDGLKGYKKSQFGVKKKWGLLSLEVIYDAGHLVSWNRPNLAYCKMKEMIFETSGNEILRKELELTKDVCTSDYFKKVEGKSKEEGEELELDLPSTFLK